MRRRMPFPVRRGLFRARRKGEAIGEEHHKWRRREEEGEERGWFSVDVGSNTSKTLKVKITQDKNAVY